MSFDSLQETFPRKEAGLNTRTILNNGVAMPWLGLGVFKMGDDATTEARVRFALESGYRAIDTAAAYGNEGGVGAAVKGCGLPREEIFVTTKIWNDDLRANRTEAAVEESLDRLKLDYVDLCLIHWPVEGKFVEAWKALENVYRSGRVKAIGVSNFLVPHLEELLPEAEVMPTVNQIEFHPYLRMTPLLEYCRGKNIRVTAWSPLMRGALLKDETLSEIASRHQKTTAQIILRWDVQNGVVTIPKSSKEDRIDENADIFDFSLTAEEMAMIDALDRGERCGPDPQNFDF